MGTRGFIGPEIVGKHVYLFSRKSTVVARKFHFWAFFRHFLGHFQIRFKKNDELTFFYTSLSCRGFFCASFDISTIAGNISDHALNLKKLITFAKKSVKIPRFLHLNGCKWFKSSNIGPVSVETVRLKPWLWFGTKIFVIEEFTDF